jgi:hypothetical protein
MFAVLCTNKLIDNGKYDGFQLRDLRGLDSHMKYFPPFSIPYVGKSNTGAIDFVNRAAGWSSLASDLPLEKDPWVAFWSEHFAAKVGKTKAALHLCYGLQGLTPNSQNFLLEFNQAMDPTGKVVVRDLLDMKLHTDWVYTIVGPCPPQKPSLLQFFSFPESTPRDKLSQILRYEIDTPSRIDSTRRMIQDSETFDHVMHPDRK